MKCVLDRFEQEFTNSTILKKITLDTSSATVEETFQEFLQQIEKKMTLQDRMRILSHQPLSWSHR